MFLLSYYINYVNKGSGKKKTLNLTNSDIQIRHN